ncbi:hypothetical protein [Clostridium sp. SM-530-WT-3G]|uniref:hypothetical protein n=1 Tax=Clostridium sp. SM-530-WT-3G TaxID=2725303 RepID=UPI00145CA37A|nr:hypothetical protein [Clostridium sp. SM-530-WT-3G]NME82719.1 hypothetical protein [Clostridium sp. SM-530-WT-3G]
MKAKKIAESGILIALTIIVLYAASILPVSKLTVLTIASCFIPIAIMQTSLKNTIVIYVASSLLSLFLIPINIALSYILFFGIYGIIKYYIEKSKNLIIEIILKLIIFNILCSIIYFTVKNIFILPSTLPVWIIVIGAQAIFLVYDYALSLIINYFYDRFHKYI